ncbi:hypothetical protein Bca4012_024683 [Brassica carinata]
MDPKKMDTGSKDLIISLPDGTYQPRLILPLHKRCCFDFNSLEKVEISASFCGSSHRLARERFVDTKSV